MNYYKTKEVRAMLRIGRTKMYELINQRQIGYVMYGGEYSLQKSTLTIIWYQWGYLRFLRQITLYRPILA
jgi:excisionase family DNA binding protein